MEKEALNILTGVINISWMDIMKWDLAVEVVELTIQEVTLAMEAVKVLTGNARAIRNKDAKIFKEEMKRWKIIALVYEKILLNIIINSIL